MFCIEETLNSKLDEMFASADYQAAVGFVFGCRRKATPICNSDQAAVGVANLEFYIFSITFGCRRNATPFRDSDQVAVGLGFGCRRDATPFMFCLGVSPLEDSYFHMLEMYYYG